MINIVKISGGFVIRDINGNDNIYNVENVELISDNDCHVITDNGIIYLDLSCTINGIYFNNINDFIGEVLK